jgi:transposase InsO family protein
MMDRIFNGLPYCFIYLDDILVSSASRADHLLHLSQVLTLLRDNGLVINPSKCVFARSSVEFLGHLVTSGGIIPLQRHVSALQDFPRPMNIKSLQRFLGLVNFYRRFLPGIAGILKPLTDALAGNPKSLEWSPSLERSFLAAKAALAAATPLVHPSPSASVSLAVDASATHAGAALQQFQRGAWRPLAFFSRKFSATEQRYSTFDRELLAVYLSIRHFRFLLEGRKFVIFTDHKPLVSALDRVTPPWSARQQRHLSFISEFTSDLRHTPGASNIVADALSRPETCEGSASTSPSGACRTSVSCAPVLRSASRRSPSPLQSDVSRIGKGGSEPALRSEPLVPPSAPAFTSDTSLSTPCSPRVPMPGSVPTPPMSPPPPPTSPLPQPASVTSPPPPLLSPLPLVDFAEMARQQVLCKQVQLLVSSPSLRVVQFPVVGAHLWCDISTGSPRPLVPAVFQFAVFNAIHGIAHPGIRATRRLVSARFVWKNMASDLAAWSRQCLPCQRGKVSKHHRPSPAHIEVPQRRFSHLHVDLVGPLPCSQGFTYLFTIIDRTTRWPEAVPLASTSAADCSLALLHGWISRFGMPAVITSDRGPQFTSQIWTALSDLLNLRLSPTTAYHPQSNGLVERFHRRLKDSLRSRLASTSWYSHLPWVLLGLRSSPREDSNTSAAGAVYGAELCLPGQFLDTPEAPSDDFLRRFQSLLAGSAPPPTRHNLPPPSPGSPAVLRDLNNCKFVFIRRDGHKPSLAPCYDGPYLVLSRSSSHFKLQVGAAEDSVSVHRLKPAHLPPGAGAALPARRGRPPGARRVSFLLPSGNDVRCLLPRHLGGEHCGDPGCVQAVRHEEMNQRTSIHS